MKTKPISMVSQGRFQKGIEILVRYRYAEAPAVDREALVRLIGINKDGETLVATAKLTMPESQAGNYIEPLFGWTQDQTMYTSIRFDIDTETNNCISMLDIDHIIPIGFIQDIDDSVRIRFESVS